MLINVNEKEMQIAEGTTVQMLLDEMGYKRASVWVDGRHLLKAEMDTEISPEWKIIKIRRLMGGG